MRTPLVLLAIVIALPADAEAGSSASASQPVIAMCPDLNGDGNYSPCGSSSASGVSINTLSAVNGVATVTRPANTTAYTGSQLIANNTSGNVTPTPVTVTGTAAGTGKITVAYAETSYTGSSAPPTQYWHLFSNAAITVSSLKDGSAYIGPYAADIANGYYVGTLICTAWQKTNDGTAQWFSPCASNNSMIPALPFKALAGQTYLYALVETGAGGYTPVSAEVETLVLSTDRDQ